MCNNSAMPESYSDQNLHEGATERREQLKEGLGVTLCTKQKAGDSAVLTDQIAIAEEMQVPAVQFDFRDRTIEEIQAAKEALIKYRESNPSVALSIHGKNPEIDPATLDFTTKERTQTELELFQELSGESYTVHPPAVKAKVFAEAPAEMREKVIDNYAVMFASAAKKAFDAGQKFTLGVENMPAKGMEGSWGQTPEDILMLVQKVEQTIVVQGVDPVSAKGFVGATLDINHALRGAEPEAYAGILEQWFSSLGEHLRVVHLYAPSEPGREFEQKHKLSLDLASQFSPHARLFIESKQDANTTKQLYTAARQVE